MQNKVHTNLLPVTPGQRFTRLLKRDHLLKIDRLKKKCSPSKSKAGRNHTGQITLRHRGGGVKQAYRLLDIGHRNSDGVVEGYEYDQIETQTFLVCLIQTHIVTTIFLG